MKSINNDGNVNIAVGRNRWETKWINKRLKFSELIEKFRWINYTLETFEQLKCWFNVCGGYKN